MAFMQTVWSLDKHSPLTKGKLLEKELEDILCDHIELINPEWLVIGRQVQTSGGPLDILCMEYGGGLIVVELKREKTPRPVTAQVIDYASCIDGMSLTQVSDIFFEYSNGKSLLKAYKEKFGEELDETMISSDVKMVIVAAEMDSSTERIITYLQEKYGVKINILFFQTFQDGEKRYISRAWLLDEEERRFREGRKEKWNNEFYVAFGPAERSWNDAVKYGFVSGGGGKRYAGAMRQLSPGDRIWVSVPHVGYVGVGIVSEEAKVAKEVQFWDDGKMKGFCDLPVEGEYLYSLDNDELAEYVVKVNWIKTVRIEDAVRELGFFGNQNIVCRPQTEKWSLTVNRLKEVWNIV